MTHPGGTCLTLASLPISIFSRDFFPSSNLCSGATTVTWTCSYTGDPKCCPSRGCCRNQPPTVQICNAQPCGMAPTAYSWLKITGAATPGNGTVAAGAKCITVCACACACASYVPCIFYLLLRRRVRLAVYHVRVRAELNHNLCRHMYAACNNTRQGTCVHAK